jgi:hypothetical protein
VAVGLRLADDLCAGGGDAAGGGGQAGKATAALGVRHVLRLRLLAAGLEAAVVLGGSWPEGGDAGGGGGDGGGGGGGGLLSAIGDCLRTRDPALAWALATSLCSILTPSYEWAYPALWPPLGLHYARAAKLQWLQERAQPALQAARQALAVLEHTRRPEGELLRQLEDVRKGAEQVLMPSNGSINGSINGSGSPSVWWPGRQACVGVGRLSAALVPAPQLTPATTLLQLRAPGSAILQPPQPRHCYTCC